MQEVLAKIAKKEMREKLLNRHNICEKEDLTSDQFQRLDGQKNGTIFEVFAFMRSQRVLSRAANPFETVAN